MTYMRTSVELDEKKVCAAKKLSRGATLRKILDEALDMFISRARRRSLMKMLGTQFFEGNLKEMRGRRRSNRSRTKA